MRPLLLILGSLSITGSCVAGPIDAYLDALPKVDLPRLRSTMAHDGVVKLMEPRLKEPRYFLHIQTFSLPASFSPPKRSALASPDPSFSGTLDQPIQLQLRIP